MRNEFGGGVKRSANHRITSLHYPGQIERMETSVDLNGTADHSKCLASFQRIHSTFGSRSSSSFTKLELTIRACPAIPSLSDPALSPPVLDSESVATEISLISPFSTQSPHND
jgi:hypothetical protein